MISNYIFNRTRCDNGAMFDARVPRRLKRRYVAKDLHDA